MSMYIDTSSRTKPPTDILKRSFGMGGGVSKYSDIYNAIIEMKPSVSIEDKNATWIKVDFDDQKELRALQACLNPSVSRNKTATNSNYYKNVVGAGWRAVSRSTTAGAMWRLWICKVKR